MIPPRADKRSTYFIFQSLLTIVLLLFFLYRRELVLEWTIRLVFLSLVMGAMLVLLAVAPAKWLKRPAIQGAWFLCDVLLSSVTLYWAHQPGSDLYVTYFLVIFGTALTENITQSFLVALVATLLYGYSAYSEGLSEDPEFWLRLPYLWIFASFTAMLTRDSREARELQEEGYKERLFHMERLAALGQISAEVAHRIKSPLTTIRVNAEVLAHQKDVSPGMREDLVQIQEEVDHCKSILQKLLDLGRIEEMDNQAMDLRDPIRSALETMKPQMEKNGIELQTHGIGILAMIQGDPILVNEALVAMLQNAVDAMPGGGRLTISLEQPRKDPWWFLHRRAREPFEILIQDTGTGIKPEQMETIFRPFFTTKTTHGSGLGLSAALRIVDKHGGSIKAFSEGPGLGASFRITFPRTQS